MSENPPHIRTLIIRDDKEKIKDLGDIVKVARAQGQTIFKTHDHVRVLNILGPFHDGAYVVEIQGPPSCSKRAGVSSRGRGDK